MLADEEIGKQEAGGLPEQAGQQATLRRRRPADADLRQGFVDEREEEAEKGYTQRDFRQVPDPTAERELGRQARNAETAMVAARAARTSDPAPSSIRKARRRK